MVEMDWFIDCGTTPFQGPIAAQKGLSPWTFQICTIIILTIQTRVMFKEFIIIDMFTNPNITHITNNSLNHNSITIIAYKITCMFPMFDFTNTNLFLYNFFIVFYLQRNMYGIITQPSNRPHKLDETSVWSQEYLVSYYWAAKQQTSWVISPWSHWSPDWTLKKWALSNFAFQHC